MKYYFNLIKSFIQTDFRIGYYSLVACFLGISIYVNEMYKFEDLIRNTAVGTPKAVWLYFLLYGSAYYFTLLLYALTKRDFSIFSNAKFMLWSIFGISVVALDGDFWLYDFFIAPYKSGAYYFFAHYVILNLLSIITILLPLILFKLFVMDKDGQFYGLNFNKTAMIPYVYMLCIMVPLVAWASFQPDFLETYPYFKKTRIVLQGFNWIFVGLFEMAYGWDFIATELIFRGFLIVALRKVAGKDVVVPMVSAYCFLHFGKPVGEMLAQYSEDIFSEYWLSKPKIFGRDLFTSGRSLANGSRSLYSFAFNEMKFVTLLRTPRSLKGTLLCLLVFVVTNL
jgi:hypothetical protein